MPDNDAGVPSPASQSDNFRFSWETVSECVKLLDEVASSEVLARDLAADRIRLRRLQAKRTLAKRLHGWKDGKVLEELKHLLHEEITHRKRIANQSSTLSRDRNRLEAELQKLMAEIPQPVADLI